MKIVIEDVTYYDIPELVKMLGVHTKSIYAWIKKGKLKTHRLGRRHLIASTTLKKFIESR
ncbi:MAG: helix-turn-helix domain-containing protein [bacterium]